LSGYALLITHQLEGGAAAINEAGAQRMRTYRIAHLLNQAVNDPEQRPVLLAEVQNALREYETVLRTLSLGDPARPLFLPAQGPVRAQMELVQSFWNNEVAPLFHQTVTALHTPFIDPSQTLFLFRDETIRRYVSEVNRLVSEIEKWNAHHTQQLWWLLNGFIVTVLIGAILLLAYFRHLVIKPLTVLHRGIERMTTADFDVRLPIDRRDEFGDVASGFNRMADELRALYATLEERVQKKTKALAERARELSVLYEIAATTAQPEDIPHLVHAVLSRTANLVGAQGWMARLNQPSGHALALVASEGLPHWEQSCASTISWEECLCGQAAAHNQTLAGCPTSSMSNGQIPFCLLHRYFVVAIPFQVKQRVIGLFSLLFAHHRTLKFG